MKLRENYVNLFDNNNNIQQYKTSTTISSQRFIVFEYIVPLRLLFTFGKIGHYTRTLIHIISRHNHHQQQQNTRIALRSVINLVFVQHDPGQFQLCAHMIFVPINHSNIFRMTREKEQDDGRINGIQHVLHGFSKLPAGELECNFEHGNDNSILFAR